MEENEASQTGGYKNYEVPKDRLSNKDTNSTLLSTLKLMTKERLDFLNYWPGSTLDRLGFVTFGKEPSRKGQWTFYERTNYSIPCFPTGEIVVNSLLAAYHDNRKPLREQAILWTSEEPIERHEFHEDVKTITKYFVEIPAFIASALQFSGFSLPMAPLEKYLLGKIEHLGQYSSGNDASYILEDQEQAKLSATMRNELYHEMKKDVPRLSAAQFLQIYSEMPNSLHQARVDEIQSGKNNCALYEMAKVGMILEKLVLQTRPQSI